MTEPKKENQLVVQYEVEGERIQLTPSVVQNYIVGNNNNITQQEFYLFAQLCKARKLNPFLREAYLIKYSDKQAAQIVVGKDVIVKRAVKHPMYDGKESGVIVEDKDGNIKERIGCFVAQSEKLVGGWCKVYRKDWNHPEYMSVSLDEAAQHRANGELNSNWINKPATMVEKVAKVRALREAFVEEFSGLYEEEEMPAPQEIQNESDPLDDPVDVEAKEVNINEL